MVDEACYMFVTVKVDALREDYVLGFYRAWKIESVDGVILNQFISGT